MGNIIAYSIVPLLLLAGIWIYNRLIRNRNLVNEAWAGIDVQLQKRHELVPNLVSTVKGYVAHESGVFEEVARIRSDQSSSSVGFGSKEARFADGPHVSTRGSIL